MNGTQEKTYLKWYNKLGYAVGDLLFRERGRETRFPKYAGDRKTKEPRPRSQ